MNTDTDSDIVRVSESIDAPTLPTHTQHLQSAGTLPDWILDPTHLDEYYHTKTWMFWAPSIPLAGVIFATYSLLANNSNSLSFIYLIVSLFLAQGVMLQYYILILSAIESRLKASRMHLVVWVYLVACIALFITAFVFWPATDAFSIAYYAPWVSMVVASISSFLIALAVRKVVR